MAGRGRAAAAALSDAAARYFTFAARTPTLVAAGLASAVLMVVVFPTLPLGAPPIDLLPHYSLVDIEHLMREYGPEGRRVHAWATPTLDTLFPLAYVTFFAGLLHRFAPNPGWRRTAWLPVFAGAWDLAENVQITAMLLDYPVLSATQVACASFFTQVKHALTPVYTLLGAAFALLGAVRALDNRRRGGPPAGGA